MRHCRHYSYTFDLDEVHSGPTCAVGCDISAPGASQMCMPEPLVVCQRREDYTHEEIKRENAENKAAMERYFKGVRAIPNDGDSGSVECPSCGTRLHWNRAGNGHVWACCETKGCTGWIQ